MTDHNTIFPNAVTHTIAEREISFWQVRVKGLSVFANAVKPMLEDERLETALGMAMLQQDDPATHNQLSIMLQDLAAEYQTSLLTALPQVCDVDVTWLGDQSVDVLIGVAHKAAEVNKDYFLPRIAPRLADVVQTLIQTGQVSLQDLSAEATD